jgi:hypothetical protein
MLRNRITTYGSKLETMGHYYKYWINHASILNLEHERVTEPHKGFRLSCKSII